MSNLAILDLDPDLLPNGTTPLHVAANNYDGSIVSSLLAHYQRQQDSPLDQVDSHGRTPLCVALQNGRFVVARLLIEAGANLEAGMSGSGHTLAEVLAQSAYEPLLSSLVSGSPKSMVASLPVSALIISAACEGRDALLKQLLGDYGDEVDTVDHMTRTALHYASQNCHTSAAQILLEYGAAVSRQDSLGSTPLHLACSSGDVAMLEVLLQDWACPNPEHVLNVQDSRRHTCGHVTLHYERFDALEYLLTHFRHCINTDLRDYSGHSLSGLLFYSRIRLNSIPPDISLHLPLLSVEEAMWTLHSAVHEGDLTAVERSLSLLTPAQVDTYDHTQHTPLMLAATRGHLDISRALVRAGANPNTAHPTGRTALMCACESRCFDVAKFLLSLPDASTSLTLFFDHFSRPLSKELLQFLLDYFRSNASAQKPTHWQKWLSLATSSREIGRHEFSQLVKHVCPWDWLQKLAVGTYECTVPPSSCPPGTPLNCLPAYVEDESIESWKEYRQARRFRAYKPRLKLREKYAPFVPPGPALSIGFKEMSCTTPKRHRRKQPKPVMYSPLHEAAISGNSDIVGFILSEAQLAGLKEKLVFETLPVRRGQTVLEVMARSFARFEDQFDSWLVNRVVQMEQFGASLPEGVCCEQALLHYLLVSAGGKVVQHPSTARPRQPSKTPLDNWPLWYSNLMFSIHARRSGCSMDIARSNPQHLSEEERTELVEKLLERYGLFDDSTLANAGYPGLISTAVCSSCQWALKLLQRHRADICCLDLSDMKHYPVRSWTPFCVSAIRMADSLNWELDSNSMTPDQFHSLYQAMLVVASEGNARAVETLYRRNIQPAQFWCERYGPRLLYLLSCHGHKDLASELAKDMAAQVCRATLYPRGGAFDRMMRILRNTSCTYLRNPVDPKTSVLSLSLRLVRFITEDFGRLFLHSLCKLGLCDLVEFSLEVMSEDLCTLAFSKLDSRRMTPLYLAAASGHFDVVKVLVQRGCPLSHPNSDAIPEIYAAVVCLRCSFPRAIKSRIPVNPLDSTYWKYPAVDTCRNWRHVGELFLDGCPFSPKQALSLRESASRIIEFFVSELSGGDVTFQFSSNDFFAFLCTLASCPCLDLATPLLRLLLQGVDHDMPSGDSNVTVKKLHQVIQLLPDPASSLSSPSLPLLDQILLNFVSVDSAQRLMPLASCRGLWGVVEKCHFLLLRDCPDPATLKVERGVLVDAAVQGEFDFLTSVLGNLQQGDADLYSDLIENLLRMAVVHGGVKAVSFLLRFVDSVDLVTTPLSDAIRFRRGACVDVLFSHLASGCSNEAELRDVLCAATRVGNHCVVDRVLELEKSMRFGFVSVRTVALLFRQAIEHGHESLALQAVGLMSERKLQKKASDPHYFTLIGLCCLGGMKDLLECIPWTADSLLEEPSGSVPTPPWVSAVIGGHIGKLSHLDGFPSLEAVERKLGNKSELGDIPDCQKLLIRAFRKMMSAPVGTQCEPSQVWGPRHLEIGSNPALKFITDAIRHRLVPTLEFYLEHLGRYAGDFVERNHLLTLACSVKDNLPIVTLILQCLFDSPAFSRQSYSAAFSLSVRLGEVECVRAFVRAVPMAFETSLLDNPYHLNFAVRSGSAETVDYILELLGAEAPDECFKMDGHGEYPLLTAFSLGRHQVLVKSSLVAVASKSAKFHRVLEPDWRTYACAMRGWFDLLMHTNSANVSGLLNVQSVAHHSNRPICSLVCLRDTLSEQREFLHQAVSFRDGSVLQALLAASDGIFSAGVFRDGDVICDPTVWNFLHEKSYREVGFRLLGDRERKPIGEQLLHQIKKRREISAHFFEFSELSNSRLLTDIFSEACAHGRSEVIDRLLSLNVEVLDGDEIKLCGIEQATAMGHFKLAADLMLRMDYPRPLVMKSANLAHSYIFGDPSYDEILNAFFSSLCCLDQRMPLASLWMTRGWSEEEARLVVNRLGCSTFAPPNPWVFSDDSSWDLSIDVDWNSFSECTLTSPCVPITGTDSTKFRHVPLLVESIVFSQAVLGLLSPQAPPNSEGAGVNLFRYCKERNYSSVIVTCQVWPTQPSIANGILNFSYRPDTRTIHSVDLQRLTTERRESTPLADPAVEYRIRLSENLRISRQQSLESLREYYEGTLGSVAVCRKCSISVKFSTDIVGAFDGKTFGNLFSLISSQLGDLAGGLGVVSRPSVLYKDLYPEYRAAARAPVKLRAFEKLVVNLEVTSGDPSQYSMTAEVSLENSTLSINILLLQPLVDHSDRLPWIPALSSYSKLVQDLEEAILNAELSRTREEGVRNLGRTLAPLLASPLKVTTSIPPGFLEVVVEDDSHSDAVEGRFEELDTSRAENLVYFKSMRHLERFLRLFCKMLRVFQYKPRLHSHVSDLFRAGLRVVLSGCIDSKPKFSQQAGVPVLYMPVRVLLSSDGARGSLLTLFNDILATGRRRDSRLKSFLPLVIPAPLASYVDLDQSNGLLYPVLMEAGVITVQMMDYYGNIIETTPTVNCRLDVHVKHLTSNAITFASSSGDPSPHFACNHLLVTEGSGGSFKITWTPQDRGLYSVSIRINDMPVHGSPFRCFSATASGGAWAAKMAPGRMVAFSGSNGTRQTSVDSPIVCVVSHSLPGTSPWARQCRAATPPPVRLMNRKPIRGSPTCLTREDFITGLGSEKTPVHHISMCSAYGGAGRWGRATSPFVSVHISNADSASSNHNIVQCVVATPLGRGCYRLSLSPVLVGSFSIFASCACCNSVLTMHWKDGRSFLPTSIYTVPGALCPAMSIVAAGPARKRTRRKGKHIVAVRRKLRSLAD